MIEVLVKWNVQNKCVFCVKLGRLFCVVGCGVSDGVVVVDGGGLAFVVVNVNANIDFLPEALSAKASVSAAPRTTIKMFEAEVFDKNSSEQ